MYLNCKLVCFKGFAKLLNILKTQDYTKYTSKYLDTKNKIRI